MFVFIKLASSDVKIILQFFDDRMQLGYCLLLLYFFLKTLNIHLDLFGSLCEFQRGNSLIEEVLRGRAVNYNRSQEVACKGIF